MEWQYIGDDQWIFGLKVRGLVRNPVAEVYFDEDHDGREGGWKFLLRDHRGYGGYETSLYRAVAEAERVLGVVGVPLGDEHRRFVADNPTPLHGEQ